VSAWVYSTDSTIRRTAFGRAMNNLWHLWSLEQEYDPVTYGYRMDIEFVRGRRLGKPLTAPGRMGSGSRSIVGITSSA